MLMDQVQSLERNWPSLAQILSVPHSESDYHHLVALLDSLIDEVGENEIHPLASLMEVVGVLVESYEDQHVPELATVSAASDRSNVPTFQP